MLDQYLSKITKVSQSLKEQNENMFWLIMAKGWFIIL